MYELQISTNIETTLQPFGVIYLATNELNGKVYVGKVESPRTMEIRWKEHLKEGKTLRRKREKNPTKKFWDSYSIKMSKLVKKEKEFLDDIKNGMEVPNLKKKYSMTLPTIHKNIERILGDYGVRTYREARKFLNGFTKENLLLDIKKGVSLQELIKKYSVSHQTINRSLDRWLGVHRVKNYSDAKCYFQSINLKTFLKYRNKYKTSKM